MSARLLVDAQARLGECALWCERTGSLWWSIALFDPASGQVSDFRPLDLPQQRGIRINDGRCDREGRFVFGLFNTAGARGSLLPRRCRTAHRAVAAAPRDRRQQHRLMRRSSRANRRPAGSSPASPAGPGCPNRASCSDAERSGRPR